MSTTVLRVPLYNPVSGTIFMSSIVRLQKDAAILTMTLDERLRNLSFALITSPSTCTSSHRVTRATGMLYELFYIFSSFWNLRVYSHTVTGSFSIFFLLIFVLQVQALSHETLGSCVRQGASTQIFKMLPKT